MHIPAVGPSRVHAVTALVLLAINGHAYRHNKQDTAQSQNNSSNGSRGSRLRHAVTLLFAANPLRTHREWTGVLERASPEPVVARPASPKVGALVRCLHRDFGSTSGRSVSISFGQSPFSLCNTHALGFLDSALLTASLLVNHTCMPACCTTQSTDTLVLHSLLPKQNWYQLALCPCKGQ